MLSHKYRATRVNIEETSKTGVSIFGKYLYAKVSKKETDKAGFAIVVSKKIEKTSVGRHQIKRKISSYIEKSLPNISLDFKKTIIFFVKKIEKPLTYKDVEKDVDFVLKKVAF